MGHNVSVHAKRLSELVLNMAQNPLSSPPEDLVIYAATRGWLSTRCYNAAINFQGVQITKRVQVQLMNEIHVSIFRGYEVDLLAPDPIQQPHTHPR